MGGGIGAFVAKIIGKGGRFEGWCVFVRKAPCPGRVAFFFLKSVLLDVWLIGMRIL